MTNRHSYSVAGSRSKMLPANPFGTMYCSAVLVDPLVADAQQRQALLPGLLALSCDRTPTTVALRLSSPSIRHSNPSERSVGGSVMNSFAVVLSAPRLRGATANINKIAIVTLRKFPTIMIESLKHNGAQTQNR